jgi:hypothetical protein
MTWITKMLGDSWQYHSEFQDILNDSSGSEMWMRSPAIAYQISMDPRVIMSFLDRAYVNHRTKLCWKSKQTTGILLVSSRKLINCLPMAAHS